MAKFLLVVAAIAGSVSAFSPSSSNGQVTANPYDSHLFGSSAVAAETANKNSEVTKKNSERATFEIKRPINGMAFSSASASGNGRPC